MKPHVLDPLDRMVDDCKLKQTNLDETEIKKWKEIAYEKLSMQPYANVIPFYKFSTPEFDIACKAIGRYGKGFKGPSEYHLHVPLLKQSYVKVNEDLEKKMKTWDNYGCSILTARQTDKMCRSVMNLYVQCKNHTNFIKSIGDSASAHIGEYIFKWVEKCIKEIGEHRVVQVDTDNAAYDITTNSRMTLSHPT